MVSLVTGMHAVRDTRTAPTSETTNISETQTGYLPWLMFSFVTQYFRVEVRVARWPGPTAPGFPVWSELRVPNLIYLFYIYFISIYIVNTVYLGGRKFHLTFQ